MSTERGLVELPNGERVHDHETGAGGHVRADQQADYELMSPSGPDDPVVIDLERGVLWVSVPASGGRAVAVHRRGFELVTTVGSAVIEAGTSDDTLVLVAEGELDVVDGAGTARRLNRGQGGVLAADGTVVVDEIHDDELVADPWVAGNTLLDRAAEPTVDRGGRRSPDARAVVGAVLARLRQPRDAPEGSLTEASADIATDEDTTVLAPVPTVTDRRIGRWFLPFVAVAVLVLIVVLLVVLSDDDLGDDPVRGGAANTETGSSTTRATSTPSSTRSTSTTKQVRAELDETSGCVQRGDELIVAGTAENARPPADRYRIDVAVLTQSDRVVGRARDTVAVPEDGGPAEWQVTVSIDESLAGAGAKCKVTGVRTLMP